jgi:hypothetical protein
MTLIPWSGILNAVVAAGPVAGSMAFLLIGLLALAALVVLGAERTRLTRCGDAVVVVSRKPPDRRAAAA